MNSKILSHIKKVIIASAIIVLCGTNAAYAFSLGGTNSNKNNSIMDLFNKLFNLNLEEYKLDNLQIDLEGLKNTENIDFSQVEGLINKLQNGDIKEMLSTMLEYMGTFEGMGDIDMTTIVEELLAMIEPLIGQIGDMDLGDINLGDLDLGSLDIGSLDLDISSIFGGSLEADITETITMDAKTAVEFAGDDAAAKLSATVYMHEEETTKWALLIHPFLLSGSSIAGSVGPYYYEKGYNVIAPDLRGFGDSEGSVALGCFESMDIYDWLVKLNAEYDVTQVIVHGISLGGATTNYLSGIDGFINNGPTKINSTIKPISELKVVGLVEDCGYVDMTEFASESIVKSFSGIEDNFDYYSKATNSLKYCDIPMLVIHGTSDSMVDPENAETVKNTVNGDVEVWMVDGGAHAFIIMGSNADEYKAHVQDFIDEYGIDIFHVEIEYKAPTLIKNPDETEDVTIEQEETKTQESNFFTEFLNKFKSYLPF